MENMSNGAVQLLRRNDVLRRCAFSNSTLYRLIRTGEFPAPIQLSPRAIAWVESEVNNWLQQRVEASRDTEGDKS